MRKGGREDVAALAEDARVRAEGHGRRLAVDGLDGDVGVAPLGEEGEEVGRTSALSVGGGTSTDGGLCS